MAGEKFPRSLSLVGDMNGDGFAELLVGVPVHKNAGFTTGCVYVYYGGSPMDGTSDLTILGTPPSDMLGELLAWLDRPRRR